MTPAPLRVGKSHLPQLDSLTLFFFIVIACLVSWSLSICLGSLGFDEVSEQGYISLSQRNQNSDGLQDNKIFVCIFLMYQYTAFF